MKIVFVIAASLAACLVCLDASPAPHGGGGDGGRGGHRGGDGSHGVKPKGNFPRFNGTYYVYRVVDANTTANQTGFISNDSTLVIITSKYPSPESKNDTKFIYTFNNVSNIVQGILIIAANKSIPCFALSTTQTYEELKAKLDKNNNTEVAAGETKSMTASGNPLTVEELQKFKNARFACNHRQVFGIVPTDDNATPSTSPTLQTTALGLDNKFIITYPQPQARPKSRGGRPGGRPPPSPNRRQGTVKPARRGKN